MRIIEILTRMTEEITEMTDKTRMTEMTFIGWTDKYRLQRLNYLLE